MGWGLHSPHLYKAMYIPDDVKELLVDKYKKLLEDETDPIMSLGLAYFLSLVRVGQAERIQEVVAPVAKKQPTPVSDEIESEEIREVVYSRPTKQKREKKIGNLTYAQLLEIEQARKEGRNLYPIVERMGYGRNLACTLRTRARNSGTCLLPPYYRDLCAILATGGSNEQAKAETKVTDYQFTAFMRIYKDKIEECSKLAPGTGKGSIGEYLTKWFGPGQNQEISKEDSEEKSVLEAV